MPARIRALRSKDQGWQNVGERRRGSAAKQNDLADCPAHAELAGKCISLLGTLASGSHLEAFYDRQGNMAIFFWVLIIIGVIAIPILVVWTIKETWKEPGIGREKFFKKFDKKDNQ